MSATRRKPGYVGFLLADEEINSHSQQSCETEKLVGKKDWSARKREVPSQMARANTIQRDICARPDVSQSRKWLFLAAVRNAPRRSCDVINLAATDDFLDLARRTASVIDEDALASGQGAVARFVPENLRIGRARRNEQCSRQD
jgi:hypothetical protein